MSDEENTPQTLYKVGELNCMFLPAEENYVPYKVSELSYKLWSLFETGIFIIVSPIDSKGKSKYYVGQSNSLLKYVFGIIKNNPRYANSKVVYISHEENSLSKTQLDWIKELMYQRLNDAFTAVEGTGSRNRKNPIAHNPSEKAAMQKHYEDFLHILECFDVILPAIPEKDISFTEISEDIFPDGKKIILGKTVEIFLESVNRYDGSYISIMAKKTGEEKAFSVTFIEVPKSLENELTSKDSWFKNSYMGQLFSKIGFH